MIQILKSFFQTSVKLDRATVTCNGHMHATCSDLWAGVSMLKSGVNLCDRNLITESLWKLLTL